MEQFEKLLEAYRDAVADLTSSYERSSPHETHRCQQVQDTAKKALVDFVGPHLPKPGEGF